jgi:hypothetical protein
MKERRAKVVMYRAVKEVLRFAWRKTVLHLVYKTDK